MHNLAYFYWDPSPYMFDFKLPLLDRPILWYGFFFATGFFAAYLILLSMLRPQFGKLRAKQLAEKLTLYVIIGTIAGARLGDLIFYQNWGALVRDPLSALRIWEGGLASHGGVVGILVALYIFSKREKEFSWLALIDHVALPAGFAAGCIRVGNFFNQELVGTPASVSWAVIFGHPADGSRPLPRHPVQLYEALWYFGVFFFMFFFWKKVKKMRESGKLTGVFLLLVFTFRFFIEFFKEEASQHLSSECFLDMAQYLSLPFIVLGIFLLLRNGKNTNKKSWMRKNQS